MEFPWKSRRVRLVSYVRQAALKGKIVLGHPGGPLQAVFLLAEIVQLVFLPLAVLAGLSFFVFLWKGGGGWVFSNDLLCISLLVKGFFFF